MKKILPTLPAFILCIPFVAVTLHSRAVTLVPSADTDITQHASLGGPDSNHSSDGSLLAVGTSTFLSYPIFQFDLSSLAGETVTANATFSLYVSSGFGLTSPRTVSLYEVVIGWTPATVTFNSFGASPGVQFGTDVAGAAVDSQTIGTAGMTPEYVSWTVPAADVQNWINNPSLNHGLLIRNLGGANLDLSFSSVEGAHQPQLTISVPEPGALSLLLLAAVGLSACGWRARNTTGTIRS